MISIEQFLLRKNIAKNAAHAKLIMIGVILVCIIIIFLLNRPGSGSSIPDLTEEQIQALEAEDLLLGTQ